MELLPTLRLRDALLKAANGVEVDMGLLDCARNYNWGVPSRCNCGLVARALGVSECEIYSLVPSEWRVAEEASRLHPELVCATSGLTLGALFSLLAAEGLTGHDVADLERLTNHHIRARAGLGSEHRYGGSSYNADYNDARAFVAYARAWALIITEAHQGAVTVEHVLEAA